MIDIETLRSLNTPEHILITEHARKRLVTRSISVGDIINVIQYGEIIKQYEMDKPFPSCLILGFSINGKYLHVVVSNDEDTIYLITAYYPDVEIWQSDFKSKK